MIGVDMGCVGDDLACTERMVSICAKDSLNENKIPAEFSYSAGTYVCNSVMYTVLEYIEYSGMDIPAGFIHVPNADTMDPAIAAEALRICIEAL